MPSTFQFQQYQPSYVGNIAEIMGIPASAQAQAAIRSAEARRQATAIRSAAMGEVGRAVAGGVQAVTQNLGDIAQQKRDAPIRAMQLEDLQNRVTSGQLDTQLKVLSFERATKGRDALQQSILEATTPATDSTPPSVDHQKVVAGLQRRGFPELVDEYAKQASSIDALLHPKPVSVAPGASLINPQTGASVYTAPDRPVSVAPGGTLVNPSSGATVFEAPARVPNSQEATFRLDGKDVKGDYLPGVNGQPGHYFYQGQDVTGRAQHIPPASTQVTVETAGDAKAIAAAIINGDQPPDTTGLFRFAGPVRAELAKSGYDYMRANLDWKATVKHLQSMNSTQQLRLRQAAETAYHSLDVIDELAAKWEGGQFPLLNTVNLTAAKAGAYGKDAQSIATQLEGQITDLTSELANVYMGGNSPTDHALKLAEKNLSAKWSKDVLRNMTDLARTNLRIRLNSMNTTGAAGLSAAPTTATPASAPTRVVYDADGNPIK